MLKFSAFAALAIAGATPALAQDGASFTGPRIEAIVGYDHVKISGLGSDGGLAYGVGAGYDFQLGGAVAGIEAEISDASTKESGLKAGRDLYAGARIGGAVGANTLLYAKAGYTNARVSGGGHINLDGFRVGAGIEHSLGQAYLKAEYRYSNYELGVSRHQVVGGVGIRF